MGPSIDGGVSGLVMYYRKVTRSAWRTSRSTSLRRGVTNLRSFRTEPVIHEERRGPLEQRNGMAMSRIVGVGVTFALWVGLGGRVAAQSARGNLFLVGGGPQPPELDRKSVV